MPYVTPPRVEAARGLHLTIADIGRGNDARPLRGVLVLCAVAASAVPDASRGSCMEIQKQRVGDVSVVSPTGRLDGIYSTAFAKEVGELITGENPKILIDFAEIDHVTSAGIRAVLLLMKKANASGAAFALCGVNEQVREVLDTAGVAPMVAIHAGRSDGVAALKNASPPPPTSAP